MLQPIPIVVAILLGFLGFVAVEAGAQTSPSRESEQANAQEFKALTIDELTDVNVISVSRRPESVADATTAVQVLTQEDIRRSGVTSLAEALRLAAGVMVARSDGRTWSISARGFNIRTANKLLVLLDGRTLYTQLFSGVFWDVQDTLLEDVQRIEVIRGPGASLWGANAVNGVINIITKSAVATQGGLVSGSLGTEDRAIFGVRYGGRLGRAYYRVYGKYYDRDGEVFATGADAKDPLRRGQSGFRIDWQASSRDEFTVSGDAYTGRIGFLDRDDTQVNGGNVVGRWTRTFSPISDFQLQVFYDRAFRFAPLQFKQDRGTYDIDLQHRFRPTPEHDVMLGAGYRLARDSTVRQGPIFFEPARRDAPLFSVFAQDEITLRPGRLFLTLGSKLENNDYTGWEIQPNVRLRLKPDARQTIWGAISRAVRMPTRFDHDLRIEVGPVLALRGDRAFESENLVAFELGYRTQPTARVSFDVATFYNRYDDLRSLETPPEGFPIVLGNRLDGRTAGLEISANYQPMSWFRTVASYTYFHKTLTLDPGSLDRTGGVQEGNDPSHQIRLRPSLELPGDVEVDAFIVYVSELPNPRVPAYADMDLRVGWLIGPDLEFSLIGQNLLHARHPEFGVAGPNREEFQRGASARLVWLF